MAVLYTLNEKAVLQFFEKAFRFPENLLQISSDKNMLISETEGYYENH